MKSPCKECIVRAGCSKDCKPYRIYLDKTSELATIYSVFFAGICLIILLYALGFFGGEGQFKQNIYVLIWGACALLNICINYKSEERLGEFTIIIFGPFVTFVFIFLLIFYYIFRTGVRKRA